MTQPIEKIILGNSTVSTDFLSRLPVIVILVFFFESKFQIMCGANSTKTRPPFNHNITVTLKVTQVKKQCIWVFLWCLFTWVHRKLLRRFRWRSNPWPRRSLYHHLHYSLQAPSQTPRVRCRVNSEIWFLLIAKVKSSSICPKQQAKLRLTTNSRLLKQLLNKKRWFFF